MHLWREVGEVPGLIEAALRDRYSCRSKAVAALSRSRVPCRSTFPTSELSSNLASLSEGPPFPGRARSAPTVRLR